MFARYVFEKTAVNTTTRANPVRRDTTVRMAIDRAERFRSVIDGSA